MAVYFVPMAKGYRCCSSFGAVLSLSLSVDAVCVCVHVFECGCTRLCLHKEKPEINVGCLSLQLSTLVFETIFSLPPGLGAQKFALTSQLSSS